MATNKLNISRVDGKYLYSLGDDIGLSFSEFKVRATDLFSKYLLVSDKYHKDLSVYSRTLERHKKWMNGYVLRKLFKSKYKEITSEAEIAEIDYKISKDIYNECQYEVVCSCPEDDGEYLSLTQAFHEISQCAAVWRVISRTMPDHYQRSVGSSITRSTYKFPSLTESCGPFILKNIPSIEQGKLKLYFFPTFVISEAGNREYEIIGLSEVDVSSWTVSFVEDGNIPVDANITGSAWEKSNKNGERDLRYKQNRQIPVVTYGSLNISMAKKLGIELLISKSSSALNFGKAWKALNYSFVRHVGTKGINY